MRVGVVGCGYWGINILRTLKEIEGVEVEALCDPNASARNSAATLFDGDVKTYSNFEDVLHESIDAVIIASPPHLHVEQSVAALRAGKDVFVEKPAAMDIPGLERLLGAAHGKTLVCDYVFLFNPLFRWARNYVKEMGVKPIHVRLEWLNRGVVRTDVSAWWSAGPHSVSLLAWLFNDVKLRALFETRGKPGTQSPHAVAHFDVGDALATSEVSWAHPIKTRKMTIVGEEQTIMVDDIDKKVWVIDRGDDISCPNIEYRPMPLEESLLDFFHCVRTGDKSPAGPEMIEKVTRLMLNEGDVG